MKIKRGEIYLVNFGKKYQSELGKIRPVMVLQTDFVNDNLDIAPFKSVLVVPLTTDIKGGRFRFEIEPRDNLEKNSELIINWMCTVDLKRFVSDKPLARLSINELTELKGRLDFFMGYFDY
ncbi:type II toxin-antitoxin system PemK/MazF family toxin [bacterium]|nr:type II toxin-antitoxin system PemK/MazF family toxin [bacterium]MBU1958116.1 type II toxin-antitoxin system PemK/MazF family toxin [bacterium]